MWRRAKLPGYVEFVAYAPLDFGETLSVCGEFPKLGSNDPNKGVQMTTSSSSYPIWRVSEPVAFHPHIEVKYRYAILRGGKFHRWETNFSDEKKVWRRLIIVPEDSTPLEDGTPSRTITVHDRVATVQLLRWSNEEIINHANTDCSATAISIDSAAFYVVRQEAKGLLQTKPIRTIEKENEDLLSFDYQGIRFLNCNDRDLWYTQTVTSWQQRRTQALAQHEKSQSLHSHGRQEQQPSDKATIGIKIETNTGGGVSTRQQAATAALEAFIQEEAPPPSIESLPLTAADGVVVASLFLPVLIQKKEKSWQIEWDLENLLALQPPLRVTRVGLARIPDNTTAAERQQLATTLRRAPWFCIAIFLDRDTYNMYYHTFCKGVLWPVFHNSLEVYGEKPTPSVEFDDQPFEADDETPRPTEAASVSISEDAFLQGAESKAQMEVGAVLQAVESASELQAAVEAGLEKEKRRRKPSIGAFSDLGDEVDDDQEALNFKTPQHKRKAHFKGVNRIEKAWRAYKRVNQIFREHVVEAYNEGDLIWIHGFQLSLLPAFVSRRLTVAKIGIFLHTPFPSSEIFRTLSMRNELIRGILSADQVGFHLYEYARHFLTTARRLVRARYSYDARGPVLNVDGREVVVSCIHGGVEPADLADVASTPAGIRAVQRLRADLGLLDEDDPTHFQGGTSDYTKEKISHQRETRIIAGIDKLERLRGLPLKLLAYEQFLDARKQRFEKSPTLRKREDKEPSLKDHTPDNNTKNDETEQFVHTVNATLEKIENDFPDIKDYTDNDARVVLVQYVISSFERNEDCERTRRDSETICERIRAKHGADCLVWREVPALKIVDRLALLKLADVFWVSSVRDGLNRWPLEYVAMQSDNLLGIERHAAALSRTPNAEIFKTGGRTAGVTDYFNDTLQRMIDACGGQGTPPEDLCTVFQPKFVLWLGHKLYKRQQIQIALNNLVHSGHDTEEARQATYAAVSAAVDLAGIQTQEARDAYFTALANDNDYNDMADEIFPSLQQIDEDQFAQEKCEKTAQNIDGELLYRPKQNEGPFYDNYLSDIAEDRLRDNAGQITYVVHNLIRRSLGRKSRRILRTYLKSSSEAQRQHAARHARCRSRRMGTLLLSENASTARVLLGASSVNPWRIEHSAKALEKILGMRCRERMSRHAVDAEYLSRATTSKWAYRVLHDLKAMNKDANHLNATHAGLGLNFRVLGMRSGFDALQVQTVARAYRDYSGGRRRKSIPSDTRPISTPSSIKELDGTTSSQQSTTTRIIVLDYGGTLVPDTAATDNITHYEIAHGARSSPNPSDEVKSALISLATDPTNIVFIVSGRERADLVDSLGDVLEAAPDLGLAAEHGFFVRWPRVLRNTSSPAVGRKLYSGRGHSHDDVNLAIEESIQTRKFRSLSSGDDQRQTILSTNDDEWERPFSTLNDAAPWRDAVFSTMDIFTQRTQGTYIEKHESSLVWQFRDADPDYGEMQAKELEHQLGDVLQPFTLNRPQILRGENPSRGGYVEVRPSGVDKGAFLSRLLRVLSAASRPASFALVVGDDESDESMFHALSNWTKDKSSDSISAYSVCIGKKPSGAVSYVDSHDNLLEILQALARISSRASHHHSALDLSGPNPILRSSMIPSILAAPKEDSSIDPTANGGKIATSNFLKGVRSLSMPAIAQPLPHETTQDDEEKPAKIPSWLTLESVLPGTEETLEQVAEDEDQNDEAAMFF
uniref:CBM20 domain-containing protein n=1 Tax=Aureoumbra lagunensis TaxID=44058 RepID=A0A7S3NNJ0_9STRA|mmetsp:Transcript_8793/g.12234  ORF Transcript_8793/g.12234 Transcript_8793/m.12234 type:complete len:1717 (+) Transcript_8793:66-5216(+)